MIERVYLVKKRCEDAAEAMSFGFLLNERRNLFSIGYNIDWEHWTRIAMTFVQRMSACVLSRHRARRCRF